MNPEALKLIQDLRQEVTRLRDLVEGRESNAQLEEKFRDLIIFDSNPLATVKRSQEVTIAAGGGTVTFDVPNNPDLYAKVYFRGKPYYVALYNIV